MGDTPTVAQTKTTQAQTLQSDDHQHGWNADDGMIDLLTFVAYGGGWIFFTFLQMASTEDSVFGLLQSNVTVVPSSTPQQIQDALNGSLDRNHLIAFAIALSVQLFLTTLAFPATRALLLAHKKTTSPSSASTGSEAAKMARGQRIITQILIAADVLTDFLYATAGHNVFAGTFFWFIPAINPHGGLGVLLVGLVYPIAVCGATIFFGNLAFKRLGSFIHRIKTHMK
jgi:hypothetical protein